MRRIAMCWWGVFLCLYAFGADLAKSPAGPTFVGYTETEYREYVLLMNTPMSTQESQAAADIGVKFGRSAQEVLRDVDNVSSAIQKRMFGQERTRIEEAVRRSLAAFKVKDLLISGEFLNVFILGTEDDIHKAMTAAYSVPEIDRVRVKLENPKGLQQTAETYEYNFVFK